MIFTKREKNKTGLKFRLPDDPRDVYTTQYGTEYGELKLDLQYYGVDEKIIKKLKVEDQKKHGSCVGQTFSKIKEINERKRLSARYIYVLTDKFYENSNGGGLWPRNAARMMKELGTVEDKYCEDHNYLNSEDYYDVKKLSGVKHFNNSGYSFVPRHDVQELKKAFMLHGALAFAVSNGKFNSKTGELTSGGRSNHAVTAFGIEELEDGRHKVYFLNSWGKRWGKKGVGYFIFEELEKRNTMYYFMATSNVPESVIEENKAKYPTLRKGSIGESVKILQKYLGITTDGIFGPQTKRYVIKFQSRNRLSKDGIVGKNTWRILVNQ